MRLCGNPHGGGSLEQPLSRKQTCQTQDVGEGRVLIAGSGNRITQAEEREGAGMSVGMNSLLCKLLLRFKRSMKSPLRENPSVHSCLRLVV